MPAAGWHLITKCIQLRKRGVGISQLIRKEAWIGWPSWGDKEAANPGCSGYMVSDQPLAWKEASLILKETKEFTAEFAKNAEKKI
jgi:hypothetical protein